MPPPGNNAATACKNSAARRWSEAAAFGTIPSAKVQRDILMATTAINGKNLLDVVKQMPPEQFDAFMAEALALRKPRAMLSAQETKLIKQINRGLPLELRKRYAQL